MTEPIVRLTKEGRPIEHRGPRAFEARTIKIDREWEVSIDGEVIGYVVYRMLTREQRTPGRRYVNRRWQSPGWEYRENSYWRGFEAYSKKDAIERLVRGHERAKKNQEQP